MNVLLSVYPLTSPNLFLPRDFILACSLPVLSKPNKPAWLASSIVQVSVQMSPPQRGLLWSLNGVTSPHLNLSIYHSNTSLCFIFLLSIYCYLCIYPTLIFICLFITHMSYISSMRTRTFPVSVIYPASPISRIKLQDSGIYPSKPLLSFLENSHCSDGPCSVWVSHLAYLFLLKQLSLSSILEYSENSEFHILIFKYFSIYYA